MPSSPPGPCVQQLGGSLTYTQSVLLSPVWPGTLAKSPQMLTTNRVPITADNPMPALIQTSPYVNIAEGDTRKPDGTPQKPT